jgi:hypothetical protein
MAISVFPTPISSTSTAWSVTAGATGTLYQATYNFLPSVYRITCVSGTNATIQFFSGTTLITSAVTSSGTIDVNLGTAATNIKYYINTGTNVLITITLLSSALSTSSFSGTLETLTTTQTYTQTGGAYVVVVGGGGGGGAYTTNDPDYRASGGGSGGVTSDFISLSGNTSVVIGAQGNAGIGGTNNAQDGNAAGATSFGSLTANGGAGGPAGGSSSATPGGTPGGGAGGQGKYWVTNDPQGQASSSPLYSFVKSGTTGGGAGSSTVTSNSVGSGIGSGSATNNAASGYGAGGRGGRGNNATSGTQGVVYLMRL